MRLSCLEKPGMEDNLATAVLKMLLKCGTQSQLEGYSRRPGNSVVI